VEAVEGSGMCVGCVTSAAPAVLATAVAVRGAGWWRERSGGQHDEGADLKRGAGGAQAAEAVQVEVADGVREPTGG
jgi:hypothetical protein